VVKEEVLKEIINYFELNKNESTMYQIYEIPTKQYLGENCLYQMLMGKGRRWGVGKMMEGVNLTKIIL
jgi:hypothetical protein